MADELALDPGLVMEFVGNAHGDLDCVKQLLAQEPALVNAAWDWGGGDWETGLGAASHMGRRDIALFLLGQGARIDLFAAAMLGRLEIVSATLDAFPEALHTSGPHGIPLLAHAQAGGDEAAAVVEFLKALVGAGLPRPKESPMRFTAEQIGQFREVGYVAVPEFWNADEVAAMRAELDRLKADGFLRNVATDGDGKTTSREKENLQLCPMYDKSDFFRAMPFAPKVAEAVSQLIGDPVMLHLDQVFLKPARHGAGTNWHQDNAYFRIADPLKGTAMWTAVHDANVANGTLHVIPGSFRESYEHRRDGDSDHHIRCYPPEEQAAPIELPAGGVVFFAYGVAHCTRANLTDHERAGVALHFINGAVDQEAQGGFPRRPYLTGDQATGGRQEYGVEVAGTWDQEVARLLA